MTNGELHQMSPWNPTESGLCVIKLDMVTSVIGKDTDPYLWTLKLLSHLLKTGKDSKQQHSGRLVPIGKLFQCEFSVGQYVILTITHTVQ